jgi:hypothetical protein
VVAKDTRIRPIISFEILNLFATETALSTNKSALFARIRNDTTRTIQARTAIEFILPSIKFINVGNMACSIRWSVSY